MALTVVPRAAAPDTRKTRRYHTRAMWSATRDDGSFLVVCHGATLRLFPPGRRKGNRFWLVRGTLPDGRHLEASSKTAERGEAERFARDVAAGLSPADARRRRAAGEIS